MTRTLFLAVFIGAFSGLAAAQISPTAPALLHSAFTTDSGDDERPQLDTDGAGNWVAVWDSNDTMGGTIGSDLDILFSRSTDNGATWSAPAALNTNAATDSGDDLRPAIAADGLGNFVVVWYSNEDLGGTAGADNDIFVSRSSNGGATWSAPALLNTNGTTDVGSDENPRVYTDRAGAWIAVWQSTEDLSSNGGSDYDIFVSRSTNNGATWTAPKLLNDLGATDAGDDIRPDIATDRAGNWVAVWSSNQNLGDLIGFDSDILTARSSDNGVTWSAEAALDSNAQTDSGEDFRPAISTDGAGTWVAAWNSNDTRGGTSAGDSDILVSRSTNDGQTWTASAQLNTNATTDSGEDEFARITTDRLGNWIAVWDSNEDVAGKGVDYDVLVSRSIDGGVSWSSPALFNSDGMGDSGSEFVAQLATDGAGNWVAMWESNGDLDNNGTADYDTVASRFVLNSTALAATSIAPFTVSPTNAGTVSFTVTFNDDVTNFDSAADVVVVNSGTSNTGVTISGGPSVYTVDVTGVTGDGTMQLVASLTSGVLGSFGNPIMSSVTSAAVTVDQTAPTISLSSAAGDPVSGAISVTATLSEASTNFVAADVTPINATVSNFSGSGTSYTFTLTPSAGGAFSAEIAGGAFTDAAGNGNAASNTLSRTADLSAPTVAMSSAAANPTNASTIAVTVAFGEAVTGFDSGDVSVANAVLSNFAGSGDTYSFDLTPIGQGSVTADIAGAVCVDGAGNANQAATQFSRLYDSTGPGATLTSGAGDPVNGAIGVSVALSEASTDFTAGDINVVNATVSGFSGSGASYSFTLTPSADGLFSATINAGAFSDAAGNGNSASNTESRTADLTAPTATLSSGAGDPVNAAINVSVTLSESSSDFTSADVTPVNADVSNFSGSGGAYSFTLTPTADGTFSATVDAGKFNDAAGNANTASNTLSRTADLTKPSVVLSTIAVSPVNGAISVSVTLSEPSTNFGAGDITPVNAAVSGFAGSGASYSFTLTPAADGVFSATVDAGTFTDAVGNANTASNTLSRTADLTAPTVAMTSASANPTRTSPIAVTVTFSEPVTGFDAGDITAGNATVNNFAGSGDSYSFDLTPAADGTVTADIAGGAATDAAGNGNVAAVQFGRTFDTTAPTATLSSGAGDPANGVINVSVTLSESSADFTSADVTPVNATVGDFSGSNASYTFTLTPTAGGTFSASVGAGTFTDSAGNANAASNTVSRTADLTGPTVTLSSAAGDPVIGAITVDIALSESSSDFTSGDVTPVNASVSGFSGSGASYSLTLTPAADGVFSASVSAGRFIDSAGNSNTASNTLSRTADLSAPTVSMSSTASDPTGTTPIPVTVTFSEAVTGFDASDISATNATVGNFAGSGAGYSFNLTPSAGGTVTADIAAGACTDSPGNANIAAAQFSRTFAEAPVINAIDDASVNDGASYSVTPTLAPGTVGTITWSITAPASLPGDMAINPSTGQVTWTATYDASPVNVTIQATGLGGSDTESWTITVNPVIPIINAIDDATVSDGGSYSATPTLQQGSGAMTWTLVAPASPPTNMAVNSSTGQITWTASYAFSPVNVTIQASGPGGTDTESWTISVMPPPIWVDFAYVGTQLGTSSQPFNTIAGAVAAASPGDVINVKGDSTQRYTLETPTLTKQLRIEAVNGSIRIGGTLP